MEAELLGFLRRDHALAAFSASFLYLLYVAVRVGTEAAYLNLARRHRALGIDDNGNERLLMSLVESLCADIDAREPAAVARVRVVPPADVLWALDALTGLNVLSHELIGLTASVDSRLRSHHRQRERVHHVEGIFSNQGCTAYLHEPCPA